LQSKFLKNLTQTKASTLAENNNNNVRLLNGRHNAQSSVATSAMHGSTIYRRLSTAKLLPHTAHSGW